MRRGPLSTWVVGARSRIFRCLYRPLREQARSHIGMHASCGSGLAREGVSCGAANDQNDRTIRPKVSMAFSEASVHGLP